MLAVGISANGVLKELYNDGATMGDWEATAWFPTAAQGYVTIRYGIRGYSKSFVCDRASGASGLYFGVRSIQQGHNDVVLTGGSEAPITRFGYGWPLRNWRN